MSTGNSLCVGVLQSAMAQKAIEMGLEPSLVERITLEKISRTGSGYSSLEALMEDCLGSTPQNDPPKAEEQGTVPLCVLGKVYSINCGLQKSILILESLPDEDPLEKLRRLQREKQCKICMDRDISIVFIPCGHLVSCKECSVSLTKCPICCGAITQKVKTYIS